MNKKIILLIVAACALITMGVIYFFNINGDNQYCNYKLGWDKCDGQVIKISGEKPDIIEQHPIMTIPPEILGDNSKQYQNYLDTKIKGQIVLLSGKEISCPNEITVIGTLRTNQGPCDANASSKNTYCRSSITVAQWECN